MISTVVEITDDRLVLSVSAEAREALQLQHGDRVDIDVNPQQGRVRRRFAPGQLLKEHQEIISELPPDRAWVDAPAVGRELL